MYEKGRLCEGVLTHTHQQIKNRFVSCLKKRCFSCLSPYTVLCVYCPTCPCTYPSLNQFQSQSVISEKMFLFKASQFHPYQLASSPASCGLNKKKTANLSASFKFPPHFCWFWLSHCLCNCNHWIFNLTKVCCSMLVSQPGFSAFLAFLSVRSCLSLFK